MEYEEIVAEGGVGGGEVDSNRKGGENDKKCEKI